MRNGGRKVLVVAFLLALAGGVTYLSLTADVAVADCGKGCCRECCRQDGSGDPCGAAPCAERPCPKAGCEECYPKDAGPSDAKAPCPKHEAMHGKDGGHGHAHGAPPAGGPPMKAAMGKHLEEMRGKIAALRALEGKMEAFKAKDDAAAFRAASLEHSKLLTDLQESHLTHMEGMMGK